MRSAMLISLLVMLSRTAALAQNDIENVIVETYYITEANDTLDPEAGPLDIGAKTYRVFLDLCADCALRAIYGDTAHPLEITSTAPFFNHYNRGKSFGHMVNNASLHQGSAGLDSWLSFRAASNARFGILKETDPNGNEIAGPENDLGLLANQEAGIGIPLTTADGLLTDTTSALPPGFFPIGLSLDTAFGDSARVTSFVSDSTIIGCSTPGVKGVTADNVLLIAQLTTAGELTFHLNVEIERGDGSVIRYVATDTLLYQGETPNGLLSYPPLCGCTDPNFLEYDPTAGCDDGSCATSIIFGCLDTNACNYDPNANFDIPALCCYGPDSCNGLDVSIVCPGVGIDDGPTGPQGLVVFPNPVHDGLSIRLNSHLAENAVFFLLDQSGRLVRQTSIPNGAGGRSITMDVSDLARGAYLLRAIIDGSPSARVVMKF
ncbi:MAG: T9SS type A sorting domain-containing protein [Flavobacteriales bacterium]|nr:T9SS type A sorting domain-containing protein [Flavobacteriales bacterium]